MSRDFKLRKLAAFCALLILPLTAGEAFGCVCVLDPDPTPAKIRAARLDAFEKATAVFSGEVVSLDRLTVRFRADKIWKGGEAGEIVMLTGTRENSDGTVTSSSCDYGFKKGERYLVYAYGPRGELKTHSCSRTALLKHAEGEMEGLDEITPHKTVGAEPEQGRSSRSRRRR